MLILTKCKCLSFRWQVWYDVKLFVRRLLNPEITLGNKDFYVIMVVFDALCFVTIVLGFASFGVSCYV